MIKKSEKQTPDASGEWTPPTMDDGNFKAKFGFSVVEEFVSGHEANDVLRELVQNEYDAGGEEVSIVFGAEGLTVSGKGRPIDSKGWSRLEVFLGTGRVVGGQEGDTIEGKMNGIGSKNFGLRSLFLFGDRIFVRSAGKMAVLDLAAGAQRVADPSTSGKRGVSIFVKYRDQPFQKLAPFSIARERELFDHLADGFLATFVKLASPGKKRGLRSIHIRSERTGRELKWRQSAEANRSKASGVSVTVRSGQLTDLDVTKPDAKRTRSFEEIEFSRTISPRAGLVDAYPGYFKAAGGKLKIAVSLPMKRKRIDRTSLGSFYYPLLAGSSPTGSLVSVSAPFRLNPDRSALVENEWNRWLCAEASEFVKDLMVVDWVPRFGCDAYLSVRSAGPAKPDLFAQKAQAILKEQPIWRTQAGKTGEQWAKAADVAVPLNNALYDLLDPHQYLSADLADNDEITKLIQEAGAKQLSVNSLVHLRCAAKGDSKLETKLAPQDAQYTYTNYREALAKPGTQLKLANALKAISKRLSRPNWKDLKETRSTLAADGSLAPAVELTLVSEDIWSGCPVPLASRLHRDLIAAPVIAKLCKPFNMNDWVMEACRRAEQGIITPEERNALYRHILDRGDSFTPAAVAAVRRNAVLKDSAQNWTAATEMALLPPPIAAQIGESIPAPARELAKRPSVMKKLRIRRQLSAGDLIAYASTAAWSSFTAKRFEDLLRKNLPLISSQVGEALGRYPFLHTHDGDLRPAIDLHLDTAENVSCLGSANFIVFGENAPLYRRLGCRPSPSSGTLLDIIGECRAKNTAPPGGAVFYTALVTALRSERADSVSAQHVLWVGGAYSRPDDVLVGGRFPKWFQSAVPVFRGGQQSETAYEALGASPIPRDRHWIALFEAVDKRNPKGRTISPADRQLLRDAYKRRHLSGLPSLLSPDVRCLVSRMGYLFSSKDVQAGNFLEDDFPDLAEALEALDAKIGFIDLHDGSRPFFMAIGLRRLTELLSLPKTAIGKASAPPNWYRRQFHEPEVLDLCKRGDFAFALHALAYAYQRTSSDFHATNLADAKRKLTRISRLDFVSEIWHTYRVSGLSARIEGEAMVDEDRIAMLPPKLKSDFDQMLVSAFAGLMGARKIADVRALSNSIAPLLIYRTSEDMRAYLRRQGIKMPPGSDDVDIGRPDEESNAKEDIVRQLLVGLAPSAEGLAPPASAISTAAAVVPPIPLQQPIPKKSYEFRLPPLDDVTVTVSPVGGTPVVNRTNGQGGSGGSGRSWSAPTAEDTVRDRLVGDRGEEIVYQQEIERLLKQGVAEPEKHVIWVSRTNPGADHDIRSIDAKGSPIWIEVKSTSGTDGRFDWSKNEFEKALREKAAYQLWRVYEASSTHPSAKCFIDPVGLMSKGQLSLEIGSLRAAVENKSTD